MFFLLLGSTVELVIDRFLTDDLTLPDNKKINARFARITQIFFGDDASFYVSF